MRCYIIRKIHNFVTDRYAAVPRAVKPDDCSGLVGCRERCAAGKAHTERCAVRLNTFGNAVERSSRAVLTAGIILHVQIKRHIIKTACRIRVRVGKRPSIVAAVADARKFFRRMIINIRLHHFAVIIAAVTVPIIVKRVSDVVTVVDDDPQFGRAGQYCQSFGVAQSAREKPPARAIRVVLINSAPNRIAGCVRRRSIGCRSNRYV